MVGVRSSVTTTWIGRTPTGDHPRSVTSICVPSIGSKEEDDSRVKATVAEILDFVGIKDKKFTPFWTQAARDIPLMRIRKLIGDVRERVTCGQRGGAKDDRVVNRGAYLLSLLKLEARKLHLSWGG